VTHYTFSLGSTPLIGDTNLSIQFKCCSVHGRVYHQSPSHNLKANFASRAHARFCKKYLAFLAQSPRSITCSPITYQANLTGIGVSKSAGGNFSNNLSKKECLRMPNNHPMPNNHREHSLRTEEGLAYERFFFAELCQPFHSPLSSQFESLSKQIWRSSLQLGIDKIITFRRSSSKWQNPLSLHWDGYISLLLTIEWIYLVFPISNKCLKHHEIRCWHLKNLSVNAKCYV